MFSFKGLQATTITLERWPACLSMHVVMSRCCGARDQGSRVTGSWESTKAGIGCGTSRSVDSE